MKEAAGFHARWRFERARKSSVNTDDNDEGRRHLLFFLATAIKVTLKV